jgi:hypothetical protein
MNGRNTSDVHTCVAKWSISWDGTFCSEVNHKIAFKLNTGCARGEAGWAAPALGLKQRILFFLEPVPHLDEIHVSNLSFMDIIR